MARAGTHAAWDLGRFKAFVPKTAKPLCQELRGSIPYDRIDNTAPTCKECLRRIPERSKSLDAFQKEYPNG